MKFFICLFALVVTVMGRENCPPFCPALYAPICASNGTMKMSFGNDCILNVFNCHTGSNFRKISNGLCPDSDLSARTISEGSEYDSIRETNANKFAERKYENEKPLFQEEERENDDKMSKANNADDETQARSAELSNWIQRASKGEKEAFDRLQGLLLQRTPHEQLVNSLLQQEINKKFDIDSMKTDTNMGTKQKFVELPSMGTQINSEKTDWEQMKTMSNPRGYENPQERRVDQDYPFNYSDPSKRKCMENCPVIYAPICARAYHKTGYTFISRCMLDFMNCKHHNKYHFVHDGACSAEENN